MKKLISYINPIDSYKTFKKSIDELSRYLRYSKILSELDNEGKLKATGIKLEKNLMYIGVNLNPDLLKYTDGIEQESVELRFVSDSMKKYTNFLEKEGILDAISADYERVYNKDFYGYVVEVKFKMNTYNRSRFIYDSIFLSSIIGLISIGIYNLINNFL
tara:strand:+ start:514 stop:993 length:480 start_codon:yes stop_codon:yes gene_type:complete